MYDKYDRHDSLVSWMIAGGAPYDEPDARHLSHLVALRDAQRETGRSASPLARLSAWFGVRPAVTAAAGTTTDITSCCAPA
jgi:hypothetical protein